MKSMATLLVLGLSATVALADNAHPRSGTSGSSSSAGQRHSGASSSGASSSGSQGGQSSGGSVTGAQARHPRAGTGTGGRGYRGGRFYYGYPYRYNYGFGYGPRSYAYFGYSPFWYDSYYWGGGGYGYWGPVYGAGRYYDYDNRAQLRIQVEPQKAKVYVDGYYAGVVDDYNGLFQRLNVSPGRHDVTVKLDGYRTHTWKLYAAGGQTLKLHYDMVQGDGADAIDELAGARGPAGVADEPDNARPAPAYGDRGGRDDRDSRPMARNAQAERGRVRLQFQPQDATIYIDGEFRGTAAQVQTVELSAGTHRVEVVRPGFVTYDRDLEVQAGDNSDLRVELEPRN